jgi:hypothetical protein
LKRFVPLVVRLSLEGAGLQPEMIMRLTGRGVNREIGERDGIP